MWLVVEIIISNVVEPYVFGQSIGVSEVALLIAAAFWAWLWGPSGLLLSTPITACLIVLAKYVPALEFLDVLLGDQPVLEPHVRYYQRCLARDQDEATGRSGDDHVRMGSLLPVGVGPAAGVVDHVAGFVE